MRFESFSSVEAVDRSLWNQLAASAAPMMEWEYFYCLEKSAAVSPARGYQPCHLLLYEDNRPVGLAPLFERDRAWVEFGDGGLIELLTEISGMPFHHGLVGTIPFTPVPGYQFLTRPEADSLKVHRALLERIDELCQEKGLSTCRIYFVSPSAQALHALLRQQGYVCLRSDYCIWLNQGYRDFDDFLRTFKSGRRTKIRRELKTIQQQGIQIDMIPGSEAPPAYFAEMNELYLRTWNKHMGNDIRAFLNETFFRLLGEMLPHRLLFSLARQNSNTIAMAIFYEKAGCLYGRYWGCVEEVPFLHFATCYYQPISYAIQHRMRMMDPGFGGQHKLFRGFQTVPASHYIKFYGAAERRLAYSILNQIQTRSAK